MTTENYLTGAFRSYGRLYYHQHLGMSCIWRVTTLLLLYTIVSGQWPAPAHGVQPAMQSFLPALQPSLHAPVLKIKSLNGFLPNASERGAMVRVRQIKDADPLQILVHDEDLKPGMVPAMYQYVVTGHGAEKFGVNERGYLYLNADSSTLPPADYQLDVKAREVGTTPTRESPTVRLTVHVGSPLDTQTNTNAPAFARPLYLANVTACGKERTALKVEAMDTDGEPAEYRIVSVSDDASRLFRYDLPSHELRVLGPLTAGNTYQVILEAVNVDGLAGRTTVFVYAHSNEPQPTYSTPHQQQQQLTQKIPQQQQQHLLLNEQQQPSVIRSDDATVPAERYQRYLAEMMAHLMREGDLPQQQTTQQPLLYSIPQQQQLLYSSQRQKAGASLPMLQYYQQQPPNYSFEQQHQQQSLSLSGTSSQQLQSAEKTQESVAFPQLSPAQLAILTQQQKTGVLPTAAAIGQFNSRLNVYGSSGNDLTSHQETITVELSEATPPNSIVTVLGDAGSRNRLYYWIADEDRDDHFGIDPDSDNHLFYSGTISTVRPLDKELTAYHTLKVQTRSRSPDQLLYWTFINITVTDENDNAPQFSSETPLFLELRVDEHIGQPVNLPIGRLTIRDADGEQNGHVTFTVLPPMDRLFTVTEDGTLTVRGVFNAAHFGEHAVTVTAMDGGTPSLETRTRLVIRIRRSHDMSTSSGVSHAIDAIESTAAAFAIVTLPPVTPTAAAPSFTRIETATESPYLETSLAASFGLLAWTSTNKPTTKATIAQTTTRRRYLAPVFQTPVISLAVEENDEDVELCRLEARYPEALPDDLKHRAAFIYVLEPMESPEASEFTLDANSGQLTLARPLDAESTRRVRTLRVATRLVDQGVTNEFIRSDALSHSATVTVQVLDVNDYIPNFEQDVYRFSVAASTPLGTVIGQVIAYDNDADKPNNNIHYRIMNEDGLESFFTIDSTNGTLRVVDRLDELTGERFTLRLAAIDGGEPPQNATTEAIVQIERLPLITTTKSNTNPKAITNDNDNQETSEPNGRKFSTNLRYTNKNSKNGDTRRVRFSSPFYNATVLEGQRLGASPTVVARLPLNFALGIDTRYLMCALSGGNRHGAFDVVSSARRDACELRAAAPLDHETAGDGYRLNITVTLGAGVDDMALVTVRVVDINDNAPRFVDAPTAGGYGGVIAAGAPAGTEILTVQAEDIDEGANGIVCYKLDGADAPLFSIDIANGTIFLNQQMPDDSTLDTKTQFRFWVIACDSPAESNRTLCAKTRVHVDLVGRERRFVTAFSTGTADVIRKHAMEMGALLSQFTGACSTLRLESIEKKFAKHDTLDDNNNNTTAQLRANWYALAGDTTTTGLQRVCRTAEYRRLFVKSTRDILATKMEQRWGLRLSTVFNQPTMADNSPSKVTNGGDTRKLDERIPVIFSPLFDLHTGQGLLMYALLAASLLTMIVGCIFCSYRSRSESRASQRRRRIGAMTTVRHAYTANGVGYPLPKYGQNNWHSVYLPTLTTTDCDTAAIGTTNGVFGVGSLNFESLKRNKFYESQMLEVPANDSDLIMLNNNNHNSKRFGSPSSVWSKSVNSGNHAFYNPTTSNILPSAGQPLTTAMLSGRGAAARAAASQKFIAVSSTAADDSASGEFSADDDQPLAAAGYYVPGIHSSRSSNVLPQKVSRYSAQQKPAF